MSKQEDLFQPEHVDEQIEISLHKQHRSRLSSSTQLIYDLQVIETENREIVANVWNRLQAQSAKNRQVDLQQHVTLHPSFPPLQENQRKGFQVMQPVSITEPVSKKRSRSLGTMAALLFVAVLVGSIFVLIQTRQAVTTRLGTPQHVTPVPKVLASDLYLATSSGVDKLSLKTGKVLWHVAINTAGQPFVIGNSVFFYYGGNAQDKTLEAVNATTGKQLWHKNYGSSDQRAVGHGILYESTCIPGSSCFIYAIKPSDGTLLWSFPTYQGTSWITFQNNVIYGTSFTHLFALNAATGALLWHKTLTHYHHETTLAPLVLNHVFYTVSCNVDKPSPSPYCYFLAYNAANGAQMWQTPVKTIGDPGMEANPVGIDGVIYYAVMGSVYAVDAHTGRILWNYTTCSVNCIVQNLIVKQNTLYMQINSNSLSVLALNLVDRSVLWSKNYGLEWTLDQGLIYIASDPNHVKVLDANNGKVLKIYTGSGTVFGFTPEP